MPIANFARKPRQAGRLNFFGDPVALTDLQASAAA
jgi:hypothetical protein